MQTMLRHSGVFALVLVAATLVSMFVPPPWTPQEVFFYFILAFIAYLGVSTFLQSRGTRKKE